MILSDIPGFHQPVHHLRGSSPGQPVDDPLYGPVRPSVLPQLLHASLRRRCLPHLRGEHRHHEPRTLQVSPVLVFSVLNKTLPVCLAPFRRWVSTVLTASAWSSSPLRSAQAPWPSLW